MTVLTIQWVHAGNEGKELAHQQAKQEDKLAEEMIGDQPNHQEKLPIREDGACTYSCFSRAQEALVYEIQSAPAPTAARRTAHGLWGLPPAPQLNSDHNAICHKI